jgi:hypothetical protein
MTNENGIRDIEDEIGEFFSPSSRYRGPVAEEIRNV